MEVNTHADDEDARRGDVRERATAKIADIDEKIRCACLGTVFNLPMSAVTLIEDLLMIGMAVAMLGLMLAHG